MKLLDQNEHLDRDVVRRVRHMAGHERREQQAVGDRHIRDTAAVDAEHRRKQTSGEGEKDRGEIADPSTGHDDAARCLPAHSRRSKVDWDDTTADVKVAIVPNGIDLVTKIDSRGID